MDNKTQYYKFPRSWWRMVKDMDARSQGAFLRAVNAYIFEGIEPADLPPVAQGVFIAIKVEYDNAKEKHDALCEANRERGRKGGLTRVQNQANASERYNAKRALEIQATSSERLENLAPANNILSTTQREGVVGVVNASTRDGNGDKAPLTTTPSPTFSFNEWWELYDMKEWGAQWRECSDRFGNLYPLLRDKVKEYTEAYVALIPKAERKQPVFFWRDEIWRNNPSTIKGYKKSEPHFLDSSEMEQYWKNGESVFMVRVGGGAKTVNAADVQKFGLKVITEMKPQK